MGIGLMFWILMLLWLVGGLYYGFAVAPGNHYILGGNLVLFILLLLLGWATFGAPIR